MAAGHLSTRLACLPAVAPESAYDTKFDKWHRMILDHQLNIEKLASTFQLLAVSLFNVYKNRSLLWLRRYSNVCAGASSVNIGTAFSNPVSRLFVAL